MQEQLFNMLFNEDEITWQTMIFELVRTEQMDPWDIDITVLSQRFLQMVKKFKELDFRVSGKIILAAAILLRIKSTRLIEEDMNQLNRLIAMSEADEEQMFEEFGEDYSTGKIDRDKFTLIPRTPQPRKRKVSVYDLVEALQKALEVKRRRVELHSITASVSVPEKKKDITVIIREVFDQVKAYFLKEKQQKLEFSKLVPSNAVGDKVYTFIPLLYLDNLRIIDLVQESHLKEIDIYLLKDKLGQV
jgi:segregation and condensation protein A